MPPKDSQYDPHYAMQEEPRFLGTKEELPDCWNIYPTPEDRQAACERLCHHLKQGFTLQDWDEMSLEEIRKFLKLYPDDFKRHLIEAAYRKGLNTWSNVLHRAVLGKIKVDPALLKFKLERTWPGVYGQKIEVHDSLVPKLSAEQERKYEEQLRPQLSKQEWLAAHGISLEE